MTAEERRQRIAQIKEQLQAHGYQEDRYGNMIHPSNPTRRFNFSERNIRVQHRTEPIPGVCAARWINILSRPTSKLSGVVHTIAPSHQMHPTLKPGEVRCVIV